jgi:hypothetical protein
MGDMATGWAPELRVHEVTGGCRLTLVGLTYGSGVTLQDAADDLVNRLQRIVSLVDTSRRPLPRGLGPPDPRMLAFVRELGEIARQGGDLRARALGPAQAWDDTVA